MTTALGNRVKDAENYRMITSTFRDTGKSLLIGPRDITPFFIVFVISSLSIIIDKTIKHFSAPESVDRICRI